jgi:hypothetical protein
LVSRLTRKLALALGTCALLAGLGAVAIAAAASPRAVRLGSAPRHPVGSSVLGTLPGDTAMGVTVTLKPRDPAALRAYAIAVSTPGSSVYRQYLTVAQFRQRFGPTNAQIAAVLSSLRAHGLSPGAVSANGLSIPVRTTAARLEKAFSTPFQRVRVRGGRNAFANARPPLLDCDLVAVDPLRHQAATADGKRIEYDALISTMPLPQLVRAIGDAAPPDVRAAANGLRSISVRCVHLGIGREAVTDKHWIYYAGDPVFHRIFVQGNASPHCNPPGGFGLTCEISYSPTKPLPVDGDALIERCVADCRRVGIIRDDDPIDLAMQVDLPYAYVLYDHQRAPRVARIRAWLREHDIHLAGRYSEWEYYNSDHAFIAGRRAAEAVSAAATEVHSGAEVHAAAPHGTRAG